MGIRRRIEGLTALGLRYAADLDDEFRVRSLNVVALLLLGMQTALSLAQLVAGEYVVVAATLPLYLGAGVILALNATGRLAAARWLFLTAFPAIVLTVVAVGFARRGSLVFLPVLPLIPLFLYPKLSGSRWTLHVLVFALLCFGVSVVGQLYPLVPPLLPEREIAVRSVLAAMAPCFVGIFGWLAVRRFQRTSEALAEALEDSRRASEARENLLGVVSHELRTPAAMGANLLDEVIEAERDPELRAKLQEARACLDAELDAIGDLLEVVTLRSSRPHLEDHVFDVGAELERLVETFRPRAESRSLALTLVATGPLGRRRGDRKRLGRVLRHLLENATAYTRDGAVTVEATGRADHLAISVTDTGPGIPPALRQRLFEAFEQGDAGDNRSGEGLGLGLTVVRSAVELMGGRVGLESSPQGTAFSLELPMPRSSAPAELSSLDGWTVLVVDDLLLNRRLLTRLVERLGARAIEADGGALAVEQWHRHDPDLILMDMQMPEVDGPEATRRIRALGGLCPILAVTANATDSARMRCEAAGMDAFLTKPLAAPVLLTHVARAGSSQRVRS